MTQPDCLVAMIETSIADQPPAKLPEKFNRFYIIMTRDEFIYILTTIMIIMMIYHVYMQIAH